MGSSRLPGKVLEILGAKTVLSHCLGRALAVPGIDGVCLATSSLSADDPVAEAAACESGVEVFRGSETDVLSRYAGAAGMMQADVILRITCDCPLIDPVVCGKLLALRREKNASYAANNFRREWPHGLDCEAFTGVALAEADRLATAKEDREHVGPFMRRATLGDVVHLTGPGGRAAAQRWTLDYPEDLAFFRALWPLLPGDCSATWQEVMAIAEKHPEITAINARHAH